MIGKVLQDVRKITQDSQMDCAKATGHEKAKNRI